MHYLYTCCGFHVNYMQIIRYFMQMNGPQRTACLAKWYNNDKYRRSIAYGPKTIEIETHSLHLWKQDAGVT